MMTGSEASTSALFIRGSACIDSCAIALLVMVRSLEVGSCGVEVGTGVA
jgi:hypothetical protein